MGVVVTNIRPITHADLDDVVALEGAHQPQPWTRGIFEDELAAENRTYLVAEDDGRIVGFGGVMVVGDEAHVTNLLVDVAWRGRGVGRRIMVDLIFGAVHAGARHLTQDVRSTHVRARSLYSGLGLAPVGVRPGYYGDEDALILWAHDIDSPSYLETLR